MVLPSNCNGSTIKVLLDTRKDGEPPSRTNPGLLEVILSYEKEKWNIRKKGSKGNEPTLTCVPLSFEINRW